MFMTQQSQRPWGHAIVAAQARPSSQTYVHQHQRFALEEEEEVVSSTGHPFPPLSPQPTCSRPLFPVQSGEVGDGKGGTEQFFFL